MKDSHIDQRYSADALELAERAVELIWDRYPGYSDDVFPKAELVRSVEANIQLVARVLRTGEMPLAEEIHERATLGRDRARQAVPLESVIQSHRCTERVVLFDLIAHLRRSPAVAVRGEVDLVLSIFDLLTQEIARSYRKTLSAMQTARQIVERDLIVGLAGGQQPSAHEVGLWVRTLEIKEGMPHLALAIQCDSPVDQVALQSLQQRFRSMLAPIARGPVLVGDSGGLTYVVFSPRLPTEDLVPAVQRAVIGCARECRLSAGMSEIVPDLVSASRACAEARDAVRVSVVRGTSVARYRDVLPEVLLVRQPQLSDEISRTRLGALEDHPHLIDTVRALVRNNLSQSAVARELYIHLNTVSQRLKRVRELTGLDPLVLTELYQLSVAILWRDMKPDFDQFRRSGR